MTAVVASARAASLALAIAVFLAKRRGPAAPHVLMTLVHGIDLAPAATMVLDGHDEAGAGVPI
jgi:anti-sigma-K factor RskA